MAKSLEEILKELKEAEKEFQEKIKSYGFDEQTKETKHD